MGVGEEAVLLRKRVQGKKKKNLKYVILHPVLPSGTVMAIFCTVVSFKLATFSVSASYYVKML